MHQSYRSPRQPVRTRSKPYARRQPPPRSGSIMATIRNIVTAPLSWFSTTDEFEDTSGKRRRAPVLQSNVDASDERRPVKRQKLASPPSQSQGYLDPPLSMFQLRSKPGGGPQDPTSISFPSASVNPNTQECQPEKLGRHTLTAKVWSRRDQSREVSMDNLPSRLITRDATMVPLPVSREASISSVPRDSSVGPVRAPFRMRTTLSPIPIGSDYGPNPKRRERDPSEPPPLTALMSNPIFVKPPPNQHPTHRSQSAQPTTTTLGALAQTSRAHNRISPRQSSLHLNDPTSHDAFLRPINASEIALSELAIYRTPLLPTRLRGSETIPEMFKPKKVHAVVPMKSGKRDLPRLGTGRKKKGKKEEDVRKPYSARGSVKKLLQRRKMEEEADKDRSDNVMDTSDHYADNGLPRSSSAAESFAIPLPALDVPHHRVYARETSSLRVGRNRMNRPDRPTTVRPSRTKFSAAFDDDDPVDQKDQDVQRLETKPMFEPPKDFTFARDTTSVADATLPEPAKEPPIAALPFSLVPEPAKPSFLVAPALSAPQPTVPVISLSPPTPQKNESFSGIPNFFANSSLLTRSSFPPPSGNLFGAVQVTETQPTLLTTPEQTPVATGSKDSITTSGPQETTQPISPSPSAVAVPTISSPVVPALPTHSAKTEVTEPTSTPLDGGTPKASSPEQAPPPPTQPPLGLFGDLTSNNPSPEPTNVSAPSVGPTMEPKHTTISSEQKGSTSSMFSFGSSSGMPFAGFGATVSSEGSKQFNIEPAPAPSPGGSAKLPVVVQSEASKETKPGFSFSFKFGAPSTSPEKPTATQFGEPTQGASSSGIFTFGTSSSTTDTQKPSFGGFPRPVTPPREEEEVKMEESPTRPVEATTPRSSEDSFFAGRVLNFGQGNGGATSPFDFGTSSGDSNPFGSKLEEKPKPATGFAFGSAGSGFDQTSPAFTFGKVDSSSQPTTPSSPFTFGTSKLPEINTLSTSQTASSSPFNFGQRPGSNQASSGFTFGQQQSPVTTNNPFSFGQGQTLTPPSFGQQQNGSVPNSPSTFNQPLSFAFGSATPTSTSNPFSFQNPSPITTTPSSAPGFSFGQQPPPQAQPSTPVSPFPVPGSPQPAGGSLFNIGASPAVQSPGTRAIKKLPTRRGGARR